MLVILLNFGDDHITRTIGNLDVIFGHQLWPIVDVIYPLASVLLFLAYGQAKGNGKLRFTAKTLLPLATYLISVLLISVDDIFQFLNFGFKFPELYWIVVMWLYPVISFFSFFIYGYANEKANT